VELDSVLVHNHLQNLLLPIMAHYGNRSHNARRSVSGARMVAKERDLLVATASA
jgi:hypothetical protein